MSTTHYHQVTNTAAKDTPFVTTVEAGRRLGITKGQVRNLIETGELKAIVISRKGAKRVHHRVCTLSMVTFILRRRTV